MGKQSYDPIQRLVAFLRPPESKIRSEDDAFQLFILTHDYPDGPFSGNQWSVFAPYRRDPVIHESARFRSLKTCVALIDLDPALQLTAIKPGNQRLFYQPDGRITISDRHDSQRIIQVIERP